MRINDKNCFVDLTIETFCVSNVSIVNYCMPLCLQYTAYNEFLVIAVWNDVKGGFTVLPENFGGLSVFAK